VSIDLPRCLPDPRTVARGNAVIPKSVTPSHIEENLHIIDLEEDDVRELNNISKEKGTTRYVLPQFVFDFGYPDQREK
jgi:glycerol 2-dehydrogenase (NADP+)